MGRPANIQPWASLEAVYPPSAAAWSGTPVRVVPPTDFIVPSIGIDAPYFNWALGTVGDLTNATLNFVGTIGATNFLSRTTFSDLRALAFDSTLAAWVSASYNPGTSATVVTTSGDGSTWTQVSSYAPTSGQQPVAVSSIGGVALVGTSGTSAGRVQGYLGGALAFDVTDTGLVLSSQVVFNGAHYAFVGGGSTYGVGQIVVSPAGVVTGPVLLPLKSSSSVVAAASPTQLLVLSGTSANAYNYRSVDLYGRTTNYLVAWGSDVPVSLAWSATDAQWTLLARASGSTTGTRIWTSPDGILWTLVATLTSTTLTGLAVSGSMWISTTSAGAVSFSTNHGASWHLPNVTPVAAWIGAALASGLPPIGTYAVSTPSGSQVLLWSRGQVAASLAFGDASMVCT